MRLIDADALADRLDAIAYDDWNQGVRISWADALKDIAEIVRGEIAVDAEPVKHGYWIDRAKSILGLPTEACSECAEWSVGYKKDYCPHCGAKMDEAEE